LSVSKQRRADVAAGCSSSRMDSAMKKIWELIAKDRFSRYVLLYAILLVTATSLAVIVHLAKETGELRAEKQRYLQQLAQTISEHVVRTLDGADQTLRYLRREYQDWRYLGTLGRIAEDANAVTRIFNQIAIANERGRVIASSVPMAPEELALIDLSDRPHFKFHQNNPEDIPRVGEPLVGRVSKQASIQLSRRISDSAGHFKGMIVTSVAPQYFSSFFQKIVGAENGELGVTLLGEDGIIRVRASGSDVGFGQTATGGLLEFIKSNNRSAGIYNGISSIDQMEKIFYYQRIPEYRLIVAVWTNSENIDRAWREYALPYLIFNFLLILVVLLGCAFLLLGRLRQLDFVEQLLAREAALKKANAFQARMISSVSHELRTPLTSILGYGGLIAQGEGDEETREFGSIICNSAEHLKNVINGILDLSRKEAGKLSVVREPVEVRSLLQRSVDLFKVNANTKGLKLDLEIDPAVPEFLQSDRTKLTQVIENLLANAIKFTNVGRVLLAVQNTGDGKHVEIRVQDSGIGVPRADLGRLFEPFYSVNEEQHKKQRGAGLGLNIVKEFTELVGGTASVESEVGKGTTFTIRLPL
jgi:signal transduction histidine kinase